MSKCCVIKAINIVSAGSGGGSGSLNTIYTADATLTGDRTVTAGSADLTFNMGANTFTVSGVVTTKGVNLATQPTNPGNSETVWASGINLYLGGEPLSLLPVAAETSGTVSATLNYLTPINTGIASTVTPPTPLGLNSRFEIVDSRGTANTNNILINFSGAGQRLYASTTENYTINTNGAFTRFRYLGATIGWVVEK